MSQLLVVVLLGLAGALNCGAGVWTLRQRDAPAAGAFSAAAVVAGIGALVLGLSIAWELPPTTVLGPAVTVGLVLPVPWLVFAFDYTGRSEVLSFSVTTAAATPPAVGLVATGVIFGSQLLPGLRLPSAETAGGLTIVVTTMLNMVQWLALLYAGGLMLVGSAVLLWTFQRYEHLDSTTGTFLGTFGTVPWLSLLFGLQVQSIAPLALPGTLGIGFLIGGVAAASVTGPYRLFRRVPAAGNVGPATVVEELEDPVIVTDDEGTVVELNDAAERALGARTAVVGAPVETRLDLSVEALRETDTVGLRATAGRTLFEPTVSELTDQHDHPLGYAVVLRDVTARRTRRQRLEVFNRVLRHNLGNDMTVILGHAELLRERVGDDLAESATAITETGEALNELSETAREADRVMDAAEGGTAPDVRLAPLVAEVLETTGRGAETERTVSPAVVVEGGGGLLRLALENVVENAVVHNDSDAPRVSVRADYEPGEPYPLTVSVADDGPGIPEGERQVIEAGTETPLEHGTGLGLWIVRWSVTRLGGEVSFGEREPRGSVVTFRLPAARVERVDEDGTDADEDGATDAESLADPGSEAGGAGGDAGTRIGVDAEESTGAD